MISKGEKATRTHYCGELDTNEANNKVTLSGWVQRRRDLGGVIFIDLRDRTGITQVVFDQDIDKKTFELANKLEMNSLYLLQEQ